MMEVMAVAGWLGANPDKQKRFFFPTAGLLGSAVGEFEEGVLFSTSTSMICLV